MDPTLEVPSEKCSQSLVSPPYVCMCVYHIFLPSFSGSFQGLFRVWPRVFLGSGQGLFMVWQSEAEHQNTQNNIGTLMYNAFMHWCIGELMHWCIGALVHWYIVAFVHWCINVLMQWCIGALVHW